MAGVGFLIRAVQFHERCQTFCFRNDRLKLNSNRSQKPWHTLCLLYWEGGAVNFVKIFNVLTTSLIVGAYPSASYSTIPKRQVELELEGIQVVKPHTVKITQKTIQTVVPTDMEATSDSKEIQAKVMDHNLKSFIRGEHFRNSEIFKGAKKLEKAMKPSFVIGDGDGENSIQHRLDVELEAAQSRAKLKYSGFVESEVIYGNDNVDISLHEKINDIATFSLRHSSLDDFSRVEFRWDW
jgi:hypothetical protein